MLISPTEQSHIFRPHGKTSSLPERHGCDFLIFTPSGPIGVQRKAIPDLLSSLNDGRLAKELAQIQSSHLLSHAILVIEGPLHWTNEGSLTISHTNFNKSAWYGVLLSLQTTGVVTLQTESTEETLSLLMYLPSYFSKRNHRSLHTRPKQRSSWGTTSNRSFAIHLLQSFSGVGPTTAEAIYAHMNGVPLQWTVTASELAEVPGVGKLTARRLLAALRQPESVQE